MKTIKNNLKYALILFFALISSCQNDDDYSSIENGQTGNLQVKFENGFENETIRFDSQFEINHSWENADKTAVYTILSYNGKLKPPYCNYENLLIIEAKYKSVIFKFYYLKGLGYIGATKNNQLISYITPEI